MKQPTMVMRRREAVMTLGISKLHSPWRRCSAANPGAHYRGYSGSESRVRGNNLGTAMGSGTVVRVEGDVEAMEEDIGAAMKITVMEGSGDAHPVDAADKHN